MKKTFRLKKIKTTFLLPKKNFLVGMGSIINIFGSYFSYNYSKTPNEVDQKAISCDWKMVGLDFKNSLKEK
ncbi:hypothetical protein EDM00_06750 [Ornithobacterium rhinotracheale]|uniref:hypothetical protein n=1 Tax=Ornithobacterium rhinotracheale TaxID=28251 RepID=UPI00129CABCE|nr:hypothetical protein [Ornithobacterium rhinotracheale]MRI63687.1 hypothetical protein [Ornithobacterium rhinotracheale]